MRHFPVRGLFVLISLSLTLLVAACGSSTITIAGKNGSTPAATATSVTNGNGQGNGQNNPTPTATPHSGGGSNHTPTPIPSGGGSNPTPTPIPSGGGSSCADGNTSLFVHVATTATIHTTANNYTLDSTYIDSCDTNGKPSYMLTITQNWGYNGNTVYDNHAVGVWYDNSVQKWAIYNQDQTTMPTNVAFNVLVATQQNSNYFTLTASAGNSAGDYVRTSIHDASSVVFVTQDWNPNGGPGHLNNHNVGVWYDGTEWAIYNEDKTTMQAGVSFNVVAQPNSVNLDLEHVTSLSSNSGNVSVITNVLTNSQPTKLLFITHNWGDGSGYRVFYDYPMGVWYSGGHWTVFNENSAVNIPASMTVNVLVQG